MVSRNGHLEEELPGRGRACRKVLRRRWWCGKLKEGKGGGECWERRTGGKCGWKGTWGPNPIDFVGPSKVLRLKMPGLEWGGGSEFKQGCDMICSFVRYKEWIKTGTVEGQWQNYNNSPGEVCWCLDQWWWRWGEVDCSGMHPGDRVFGTSWCLYILSSVTNKIGDLKKKTQVSLSHKIILFSDVQHDDLKWSPQ